MIAVDAMGGDRAPEAIVRGAVAAAQEGIPILLCGPQATLISYLPRNWESLPIELELCEQSIAMAEEPSRAVRTKSNSSLMCAMKAVASERAAAFFSAGNSGAIYIASVVLCGRLSGIHRPAIGTFLPTRTGSFFCLDVGANVDAKAEHLYQFALMGTAYVTTIKQIDKPRIGLLSNGHEAFKGSSEVKKAYERLQGLPHFIGNIEATQCMKDDVDIVVCDGFVGNIMLKAIQGTAHTLFAWIKDAANQTWMQKLGLWMSSGLFRNIKQRSNYASVGGALLLGVQKPVIIAHGRSDSLAVKNGIIFAHTVAKKAIVTTYNAQLRALLLTYETQNNHVLSTKMSSDSWQV